MEGQQRWRRLAWVLVLLGLLAAGGLAYRMLRQPAPQPPQIDLTGADPAVASAITAACDRVRVAPRDAGAWGFLGMILHAHEHVRESADCFRQAERLDPRDPRWPYYLGVALAPTEPEEALPKLRRAVALWGKEEQAPRLRLAGLLLAQDHQGEAQEQFQKVLDQAPDNAPAHLGLARVAVARNDPDAALGRLEKCLADPGTEKPARALRAELYHRKGDSKAAERERRLAQRLPQRDLFSDPLVDEMMDLGVGRLASVSRADRLVAQRRVPEAVALLQQTTSDYPDSASAWLALGRCYLENKQPAEAERALRTALARQPKRVECFFYLGVALVIQKRTADAADCFRRAVDLRPDFVEARSNLGRCLRLQGKRDLAIREFQAVLRYKPSSVTAHVQLGELLRDTDPAQARKHLESAVSLAPDNAQARKLLDELSRSRPSRP
jgi:tetratricopeptide (TPR) repeat protein